MWACTAIHRGRLLIPSSHRLLIRHLVRCLWRGGAPKEDHASDGSEALERVRTGKADLVLLDLGLPSGCGLDVLRELRSFSEVPVIVVSRRAQVTDRVLGPGARR